MEKDEPKKKRKRFDEKNRDVEEQRLVVVLLHETYLKLLATKADRAALDRRRSILWKARIQLLNLLEGRDLDDGVLDCSIPDQANKMKARFQTRDVHLTSWSPSERKLSSFWEEVERIYQEDSKGTYYPHFFLHPRSTEILQITDEALDRCVGSSVGKEKQYKILGTAYLQALNLVEVRDMNEVILDWDQPEQAAAMRGRIRYFESLVPSKYVAERSPNGDRFRQSFQRRFEELERQLCGQPARKDMDKRERMLNLYMCTPPLGDAWQKRSLGAVVNERDLIVLVDAIDAYRETKCFTFDCGNKRDGKHRTCRSCRQPNKNDVNLCNE